MQMDRGCYAAELQAVARSKQDDRVRFVSQVIGYDFQVQSTRGYNDLVCVVKQTADFQHRLWHGLDKSECANHTDWYQLAPSGLDIGPSRTD